MCSLDALCWVVFQIYFGSGLKNKKKFLSFLTGDYSSSKRVSVQTGYILEGLQEAVCELMLAVKVSKC